MNTKPDLHCSANHVKAGLGIWACDAANSIRSLRLRHLWVGLKVILAGICSSLVIGLLFLIFSALVYFPGMIYLSVTDDTIGFQEVFRGLLSKSVRESALMASMVIYAVPIAIYSLVTVIRRFCELGKKTIIDSDEVQS
ncbi:MULTISPECIES: hypothetical protein [Pseudomonas]|uniref:hypothetical protein n=1 Tax=Pseudomonas TaxID=286 RepID=UPI000F024FCF|nr:MULTISPECIES: hypothetical protein [Pseudomonas]MBD8615523.1 hypothetical protein [Pseudomonas putida]MBD8681825.1 hypothetical protein [Pseudomonas sp. CFBP 13719]